MDYESSALCVSLSVFEGSRTDKAAVALSTAECLVEAE